MKLFERLADLFAQHRPILAIGVVLMSFLAAYGMTFEPEGWREEDDTDEQVLKDVRRKFRARNGSCLLVLQSEDFFTSERIAAARRVDDAVSDLPFVTSILWLKDVTLFDKFGLPYDLLPEENELDGSTEDDYRQARTDALEHPLVRGQLISENGKTLILSVSLDRSEMDDRILAIREIGDVAREAAKGSEITARLTGSMPLNTAQQEVFDNERLQHQLLGYGLVLILAIIIFRRFEAVLIVAGAPVLGVFWAMGVLGLMNEELNGLAEPILPVLITMVGFTDGVHLMIHIREKRAAGLSPLDSARSAVAHIGLPCFLTSLTTAIGFSSLMLAHSELVRGFGRACAVGVVTTFFAVVVFIPLMSSTFLGRKIHHGHERDFVGRNLKHFGPLIDGVLANAGRVSLLGIMLMIGFTAVAFTLRPDNRLEHQLPSSSEAYHALKHCDDVLGGIQFIQVVAEWPNEQDENSPEFVRLLQDVENVLASEPLVKSPLSLKHLLLAMPAANDNLAIRVPFVEYLPESLTRRFYRPDLKQTLVTARIQDKGIARYEPVFQRIEAKLSDLERTYPGYTLKLTGDPVVRGRQLWQIVEDLASSLGTASFVIFIVMGIVYRSLKIGLISVVPNMLPLVVTASLLAAIGRSLDIYSVCAFTICLGIAVDDTIHFLSRYRYEMTQTTDVKIAIRNTFMGVGRGIVTTTVVLVCGFTIVLTSDLPGNRAFAAMACSTIAAALFGDLLILPALLAYFLPSSENSDANAELLDSSQKRPEPAVLGEE